MVDWSSDVERPHSPRREHTYGVACTTGSERGGVDRVLALNVLHELGDEGLPPRATLSRSLYDRLAAAVGGFTDDEVATFVVDIASVKSHFQLHDRRRDRRTRWIRHEADDRRRGYLAAVLGDRVLRRARSRASVAAQMPQLARRRPSRP